MTQTRKVNQSIRLVPENLIDIDEICLLKKSDSELDRDRKDRIANKVTDVYGKVAVAYSLVAKVLDTFRVGLKTIPVVGYVVDGIELLLATIIAASGALKKDGKWRRRIKIGAGIALIAVAIASLVLPEIDLIVFLISAGIGFFQSMWNFGAALISRLSGSWKKEKDALEKDEREFYELLQKEPKRKFEVLERAREYAVKHNVKEYDQQIQQIEEQVSVREAEIKASFSAKTVAADDFDKELAREISNDKIRQFLIEEKEELFERKDAFNNSIKKDFLDTLTIDERRLVELDFKIHQRRKDLKERKSDVASDGVTFVLTSIAVAGAALIFTPLFPIGGLMILGSIVFSFARQFDIPFKWATRLSNYIFEPQKVDSVEEIKSKVISDLGLEHDKTHALTKDLTNNASLFKKLNETPASQLEKKAIQPPSPAQVSKTKKEAGPSFWSWFSSNKVAPEPEKIDDKVAAKLHA